ncbi:MAG: sulfatase [Imperialibacter sp.]|uniref:sulfatase family protein n=1 Tax=Imperialibacter sp. TaxID=2038411 RepID=UPI0032ED0929
MTSKKLLTLLLICLSGYVYGQKNRPNIIFILTDDQRWDALGHAGNSIIQTPEMDKLAREGVYFKNAFVTTPICAASRATIITGLYERKHNYTFQQPPVKNEFIDNSYPAVLKSEGYYGGFLGKMGVNFENKRDTSLFDVYKPEPVGAYFRLVEEGTKHKHTTDVIRDNAIDFIEKAPADQPFCLSISFHAPHADDSSPQQYFWPQEVDSLYQNVTIPGPSMADDNYFMKLPLPVREGFNRARWNWRFDSPEKYQQMVKGYYRMITGIDRAIAKIRTALEAKGVDKNTVIILMGDNGYFLGERQLAGKWLMYEPSLRVPLIIYDPSGVGAKTVEDMALNVDIAPTILDFAQAKVPGSYQGMSLTGHSKKTKMAVPRREAFLCEHLWNFKPIAASEGIRTEKYKYFRYRDIQDSEELYDLANDPWETKNLVQDKASEKILAALRKQCNEEIESLSK